MKSLTLPILICLLMAPNPSFAQTTISIDLSNSKIGMERSGAPTIPAPAMPDFSAYTWTCNMVLCIGRTLMTVDLSAIPANATILDARLSLYAAPNSLLGSYRKPTYGTENRGTISRITSEWEPETVTWNNQPTISNTHQLKLKNSNSTSQNYVNLNATAIIQDMIDYPSYGFLLKMSDETNYFKSLIFGSNLNTVPTITPKLIVTYTTSGILQKAGALLITPWEVSIAPNPTVQNLVFSFSDVNDGDQLQISVFSITGQLLRKEEIIAASTYSMDVAQLTPGMYFYKAENKTMHTVHSGKFLKQ